MKPRSDSKLKTLPEERQAEIADFAQSHSLAETRDWLHKGGVDCSISSLSQFLSWFRITEQLARNRATVQTLLEEVSKQDSSVAAARIDELGHLFFAAQALERQDPRSWYLGQRLALRKVQLMLETEKHRLHMQKTQAASSSNIDAGKPEQTITKPA